MHLLTAPYSVDRFYHLVSASCSLFTRIPRKNMKQHGEKEKKGGEKKKGECRGQLIKRTNPRSNDAFG